MNAITDRMLDMAGGADEQWLVGETITAVYPVVDSDRAEFVIVCESGKVYGVSCDPIRDDPENGYAPYPSEEWGQHGWEVVMYDCTDVEAGRVALANASQTDVPESDS